MPDALEKFEAFMRAERLVPGTLKTRLNHLRVLERGLPVDLLRATHADLIAFLGGKAWSAETHRAAVASIRKFYRWALAEGLIPADPTLRLSAASPPRTIPKPIPEDLLEETIARADAETRLMLILGAYAGLRRAEIANVHVRDITESGLRVVGKGSRVRLIPVHPRLAREFAAGSFPDGWLFPSPVRKGQPVTPDYVANRVEAVIPAGYSCHKLRHRFASLMYANTRDLFAVQTLLGHSSPETTSRYVLVPVDSLRAAVFSM